MGLPEQQQGVPGIRAEMNPVPDCEEQSHRGSGELENKAAVVTGGDLGIGRAVAIAFAREGAEPAPAHVLLASDDGSYVSGARIAVTGGSPIL